MPAYVIATTKGVNDRRGLDEYWSRAGVTFEGTRSQASGHLHAIQIAGGERPYRRSRSDRVP